MGPHKPVTQGLRSPLILSLWDPRFKKKKLYRPYRCKSMGLLRRYCVFQVIHFLNYQFFKRTIMSKVWALIILLYLLRGITEVSREMSRWASTGAFGILMDLTEPAQYHDG